MERIRHIADTQQPHTLEGERENTDEDFDFEESTKSGTETHPEQIKIREYLDNIDEELLFDIILTHVRKSGLDEELALLVPLDNIKIELVDETNPTTQGTFEEGYIESFTQALQGDELDILRTVIHEELHAVTRNFDLSGIERADETGERINISSNEAITELVADHIFTSYLYQTGEYSTADVEKAMNESYLDFSDERQVLEFYIELISMLSGVSMETAREGVVRTYFRNTDIMPTQLAQELAAVHPELPKKMQQVLEADEHDQTTLPELISWLLAKPIASEHREAIEKLYPLNVEAQLAA